MNYRRIVIVVGIICIAMSLWVIAVKKKRAEIMTQPPSTQKAEELYSLAVDLKKEGDMLKSKEVYQKILTHHVDADNIDTVQKELEEVNMNVLFSNLDVPGKTVFHEVVSGDTLGKLAAKYDTTMYLIKKSNNLKSDVIRVGQRLRIWTGQFNVFVDKSQNILMLKDGNDVLKIYNVSTGENNSTPIGEFKIVTKLTDPVWFNRGAVVPPESPANVLGTRWLGFDYPGYGIHGTIEPETIGAQVTAGCVRMYNQDVEEVYEILPIGTEVVIVD